MLRCGARQYLPGGEMKQRFWTAKQTAAFLGVQQRTLTMSRYFRRYPLAYVKVGAAVRYARADVLAFGKAYDLLKRARLQRRRLNRDRSRHVRVY